MKIAWAFIKWQISRMDVIDKFIMLFFGSMIASLFSSTNSLFQKIMFGLSATLVIVGLVTLTVYLVKQSYKTFCQERQKLFESIKNSDK